MSDVEDRALAFFFTVLFLIVAASALIAMVLLFLWNIWVFAAVVAVLAVAWKLSPTVNRWLG